MTIILSILSFGLISMILIGFYLEFKPINYQKISYKWLKGSLFVNFMSFAFALFTLLFLGMQEVMAIPTDVVTTAVVNSEVSIGKGLAMIGIGLPTGFATIAAGMAVGPIGAASLAAISEKPENFGRSLIYLGLAEGIAIYGLVVSILLMGKI